MDASTYEDITYEVADGTTAVITIWLRRQASAGILTRAAARWR